MITTPPTSANGFDTTSTHRKKSLVILLTEPLYRQHLAVIDELIHLGFNLPLLEELLLHESLGDRSVTQAIECATQGAYARAGLAPTLPSHCDKFVRALMALMLDVWQRPPYSLPNVIVYQANRYGYHAKNLALEITYRDPYPVL